MGEKGSLKNRIKDFFKIKKRILKKKQKEIEIKLKKQKQLENEQVKYSKPRIILTIVAGYLISVATYLFTKKSNNTKKNELEKIKIVETKIDSVETLEGLQILKQEAVTIKNKLISEKKLDFSLNKKTTLLINKIDKKKDEIIKKKDNDLVIAKEYSNQILNVEDNNEIKKEIELLEKSLDKVININDITIINEKITKLSQKNIDDKSKDKLKYLKVKLEVLKKEFIVEPILPKKEDKIEEKENIFIRQDIFDKEESIEKDKTIPKKVVPTLAIVGGISAHLVCKMTNEISDSLRFDSNTQQDKKTHDILEEGSISEKEDKIENIDIIDENINVDIMNANSKDNSEDKKINVSKEREKKDIVKNKEIKKEEKKLEEEKLEDFYISIKEIKTAHKVVEQELLNQEDEIAKIKMSLARLEPVKRKKSLLSFIGSMSKKILDTAFTLSPLAIFKNKLVGGIVSSVLLNHRVKKIRKISSNNNLIYYYSVKDILKQITDKKDAIIKNININVNTISEIQLLKSDILKEIDNDFDKYPEIFNIINNLNILENQINEKNEKLQLQLEKVKKLEKKGKTKLKKMAA